jgi:hypothetical protein
MKYFSIASIAKNEHPDDLREFCCFHRVCGVEHVHIFDNESDTPISSVLKPLIDEGFVSVYPAPGRGIQMKIYADAAKMLASRTKFLALIDIDEYLVIQNPAIDDIKMVLQNFDKPNIGSFQVSWRIFGSNKHKIRPEGTTIENYTTASPIGWAENLHTKSVCRPDRCLGVPAGDPHHMRLQPGYVSVNGNHTPMMGAFSPEFTNSCGLQLNHYVIRSLEDFQNKIKKGRIDTEKWPGKTMSDFDKFDAPSKEFDGSALRFVDLVKTELTRIA